MSLLNPPLTSQVIEDAGAFPFAVPVLTGQVESLQAASDELHEILERAGRTTYDQTGVEDYAGLDVAALGDASQGELRALGVALHTSIQHQARALSYLVVYLKEHGLPDAEGFRATYDAVFGAPDPLLPAAR